MSEARRGLTGTGNGEQRNEESDHLDRGQGLFEDDPAEDRGDKW
jgi:hypothetical protein